MRQLIALILFISVLTPSAFAASTWRCSGGLVGTGNSQMDVINRCGEPYSKSFLGWGRRITKGWGNYFEDVPIEEWVYIVSNSLYYVLKFEGNELKEITSHFSY
ncbi:DUF2845 domain-containing protein [Entomomonas asaccharolytica]|uniref:DUF2845 domain-containing protein n=1 Tax=Entomomonas asaccharolytica TaxID=2785331 RepID=A0A974NEL0_9GAMM|nr:DUF2845 domain-containing protein [Entomomonas asaccharolytica]QQP84962.1 DUF2845 domain-containing protein [Entomomonas asaccharolytica]